MNDGQQIISYHFNTTWSSDLGKTIQPNVLIWKKDCEENFKSRMCSS
jgi:hypothetical protein